VTEAADAHGAEQDLGQKRFLKRREVLSNSQRGSMTPSRTVPKLCKKHDKYGKNRKSVTKEGKGRYQEFVGAGIIKDA